MGLKLSLSIPLNTP